MIFYGAFRREMSIAGISARFGQRARLLPGPRSSYRSVLWLLLALAPDYARSCGLRHHMKTVYRSRCLSGSTTERWKRTELPFNHCAQAFVRISISESTFMALRLQAAAEMARYIMLKCEPLCFFYSMKPDAELGRRHDAV